MKTISFLSPYAWIGVCLLAIVIALIFIRLYFQARAEKKLETRRRILDDIRRDIICHLVNHDHATPYPMFLQLDVIVKKYNFLEEELGHSPVQILGHAVMCQQLLVQGYKKMYQEKKDPNLLDTIKKVTADYKTLNERWIREKGDDPNRVHRFDIADKIAK